MLPIRTILHPTDFSKHSEFAFTLACSLARDYGAKLVLVHVVTPPIISYGEGVLPPVAEDYREEAREKLLGIRPLPSTIGEERRLVEGDPATEILRVAQEIKADVLVMGTHGRTGLGRLLMGSVAEVVVRKAPCPVLTVKTPAPRTPPPREADRPEELPEVLGVAGS